MSTMPLLIQAAADVSQRPIEDFWPFLLLSIVRLLVVFGVYLVGVALLTLAERKVAAWIQDRHGPNRTGPGGLLQPAADGLKNFMKEETLPTHANRWLFLIAPAVSFIPALITGAVIPWAAPLPTPWGLMPMVVAELPVGFLFILAISSLGVYGIALAGWASNNKYSLLGGLRSSAQMISYEIAMGMSTIAVLVLAGNVSLSAIITQQQQQGWNVFLLSIAFMVFLISAFAETNRLPFDLPEAESELVGGYHTEYSAMKYSLFMIAEFANMVNASALTVALFFGGWDIPFTDWDNVAPFGLAKTVLTLAAFAAKTLFFLFFFIWIRWTLPRFRYDQLMSLGWKVLLPVMLAYIVLVAGTTLALDAAGVGRTNAIFGLVLFAMNIICVAAFLFFLDRGRLVSPAASRLETQELNRLREVAIRRARLAAETGN